MDLLQVAEERSPALALFEHRARAQFIVHVLIRYGLADAATLTRHPPFAELAGRMHPDPELMKLSRGERMRDAMLELGTTFIKIGQILSTRADLVGESVAADLKALQADDPADSPEQIAVTVSTELGTAADEPFASFASFDTTPIASASVAQACSAQTLNGDNVIVKVRHAGVPETVNQDLAIILALAQIIERDVPAARGLQPVRVAKELSDSLRQELDFRRELGNLIRVSTNFADHPQYAFPTPFPELSGEAVLTMSRLDGVRLSDVITDLGSHTDDVIRLIADMYFHMIFVDGLFHADPHPGNLLLLPDGRLGVLDFGKVGRLRDGLREAFIDFLAAVFSDDLEEATRCMLVVAPGPSNLDTAALTADLEAWIEQYFPSTKAGGMPHTDLGAAVSALLEMVHTYQLRMPTDLSLMMLVVVQLQGLLRQSGSTLTLTELLLPYAQQMRMERMSPKRLLREMTRTAHRWEHLISVLPGDLTRMFEAGSRGELKVPLVVQGLDKPVNRLAFALMASATISGATTLLSRRTEPTVGRVSIPGLVGAAASTYLSIEVIRAARRAGGL